jgi:hypothetical protein
VSLRFPTRAGLAFWLTVFGLAVVFLGRNAHLQLASDDFGWLRGETPTVFDRYRVIPRAFFIALHGLVGPRPEAALAMSALFHAGNALLVHALARRLLGSPTAARAALVVFLINPITLATITWFSCFSYVLGTTLALLSLLAAWRAVSAGAPWTWALAALACYGVGLFCTHELFLLPACFLVLGWLGGMPGLRRAAILAAVAASGGALVNAFVYDFGRHGIESRQLVSLDFAAAWVSSAFAYGLSLAIAYPLSFLAHTLDFLRVCFEQEVRWAMTFLLVGGWALAVRSGRGGRLPTALALCFAALITPYVIRLYLMPGAADYHISYVLTGRVFYLPFTMVSLAIGHALAAALASRRGGLGAEEHPFATEPPWDRRRAPPVVGTRRGLGGEGASVRDGAPMGPATGPGLARWLLLPLFAAWAHSLFLYGPSDFMGLSVWRGGGTAQPPPWSPYAHESHAWLLCGPLLLLAMASGTRWRQVLSAIRERGLTRRRVAASDAADTQEARSRRAGDGTSHTELPRRRLFARRLVAEAAAFVKEIGGEPQRRLSDLADLPRERLALLTGAVAQGVEWTESAEAVQFLSRASDGSATCIAVLERTPENLAVFDRLNGVRTLGEIADSLTQDLGLEREQAWGHAVTTFFGLVEKGVCVPANVVD